MLLQVREGTLRRHATIVSGLDGPATEGVDKCSLSCLSVVHLSQQRPSDQTKECDDKPDILAMQFIFLHSLTWLGINSLRKGGMHVSG